MNTYGINAESNLSQAYQIRVEGHLGQQWTDWFDGMTITLEAGDTLLCGAMPDQARLYGVLKKVRDLGMPLISVNRIQPSKMYQSKEDTA